MARPWNDVAISASIHASADTHIEFVTYGRHGDTMALLYTLLTGDGSRVTRPLLWLGNVLRHPVTFLKTLWPVGWSRRTVIFLVMQTPGQRDLVPRPARPVRRRLAHAPSRIPRSPTRRSSRRATGPRQWLAQRTGGYAQSMVLEAWANIPDDGAHPRRRRDRPRCRERRRRPTRPPVRLPQLPRLRRLDRPGQSGRESLADDHGDERVRDEPGAGRPHATA